jgi:predicted negative regulator of RcsB-dependent stress response
MRRQLASRGRVTLGAVAPLLLVGVVLLAASEENVSPVENSAGEVKLTPGAALRGARQAMAEQRPEEAVALLSDGSGAFALVGDHAERLRVEALLQGGQAAQAARAAHAFASRYPDSLVADRVASTLGQARVVLGDEAGARAAFQRAVEVSHDAALRAERGG